MPENHDTAKPFLGRIAASISDSTIIYYLLPHMPRTLFVMHLLHLSSIPQSLEICISRHFEHNNARRSHQLAIDRLAKVSALQLYHLRDKELSDLYQPLNSIKCNLLNILEPDLPA
jgi:hypothetical protein